MDKSHFESYQWVRNDYMNVETPAITPGNYSSENMVTEAGIPVFKKLSYGVHWNISSYPAWSGRQPPKDARENDVLPSTPTVLMSYQKVFDNVNEEELSSKRFSAPFGIDYIAAMVDQIRCALGFQFDASVSVFELLMSQLDSKASRSCPRSALRSLHRDYISGSQANFRKWYFASQMDQVSRYHEAKSRFDRRVEQEKEHFDFSCDSTESNFRVSDTTRRNSTTQANEPHDDEEEEITLAEAEAMWDFHHGTCSDSQRLVDILIYLFCWTEANQVRFMPECVAFLVFCCREYYSANYKAYPENDIGVENLPTNFFLDNVVTPLYNCYRLFNYYCTENCLWIRREGDHKDFIGYDDMNQLFWFRSGIERLILRHANNENAEVSSCKEDKIINYPLQEWYLKLGDICWAQAFSKTYRESRSWLHNLTNFSRIWTLHASVFWFYTSFNAPTLYTSGYNYMDPEPPKEFVRFTIMSLGGLAGPIITFLGLLGELRFVPRAFPGAKPILPRLIAVISMLLLLLIPGICNLTLNRWDEDHSDLMPATVIAGVLFSLGLLYTLYFSFQPLDSILGCFKVGMTPSEVDKIRRRFLANDYFTSNLAKQNRKDSVLSWAMCLLIFAAKFVESYFFLTLSLRDPIRELGIMSLEDTCVGDSFLLGSLICRFYPKIILVVVILTDMTLFFLDTYLWYVIFNTIISVSIAFKAGTSIWSPWRNIYSRLPQRISTKLLAPSTITMPNGSRSYALRVVWNSIVDNMYRNNILSREQSTRLVYLNTNTQEPRFFTMEEDGRALERETGISNAYRRISFFAQSLSTPMQPAIPVNEMPSFTVLIPHYKEKMVLGLSETIRADTDAKITILEYLQKLYPHEWENYIDELLRQIQSAEEEARIVSAIPDETISKTPHQDMLNSFSNTIESFKISSHQIALQKLGFSSLDPNDTERTRLWCSERTQTLYRTIKGFANYSEAIRVLKCAEDSPNQSLSTCATERAMQEVLELCSRKFRLLVAMQLYSQFSSTQLQEVETMMNMVPELTICFVEKDETDGQYYSCIFDRSCPLLETGKRKPRLRIKLSGNPFLGDGKSDNQNNALPFYRGEYLQLVDANQDNYLEECLKIRNILMEFEACSASTAFTASSIATNSLIASPKLNTAENVTSDTRKEVRNLKFQDIEANAGIYRQISALESEEAPVAIVGAREYIFSENIGILGDVAAGKEQTFGTLFSRTLARIGAKLHYGHPDFLNAIFMTTRGGVSKGQRGLHLNEDIYAGMTAMLRGGRIRHSEYFQCGKGRDLGFVSILNFTAKIGAGMGEQMLSREYFYMGTQLPFDRFISFYYAHPGFHLNNVFIMISLEMLLVVTLWISSIASVSTTCIYNKEKPFTALHVPGGCANVLPLVEWLRRCVISIFLVFFVSLCPLFFQELTEKGLVKSVKRVCRHFGSLSMLFEIFACRIYARSFWEDMSIGGAKYLATGRGMAIARLPFYSLYSGYYPEILCGIRCGLQLWFASYALWNPSYLWFWVTTFSLCMSPILYNPHQFAFTEFFNDYRLLLLWFWEASSKSVDPINNNSWISFNREARGKLTGVKRRTSSAQSSRPTLRNSVASQVGAALLTTFCLGLPYVYVGTQKSYNSLEEPRVSALVRMFLVSLIPIAVNVTTLLFCLPISAILYLCRFKKHANIIAMVVHTTSLLPLIISWWILFILESQEFYATILGAAAVCSVHYLIRTILTVLFVRKQRSQAKTNDPWWSGDWASAGVGWKLPLVVAEEFVIKSAIEQLEYAYDFLACHVILLAQVPFLLIPCIDKLHTLFLMWLKPSVTEEAARTMSLKRKKKKLITARYYSGLFIIVQGLLLTTILLPLYAPQKWLLVVENELVKYASW